MELAFQWQTVRIGEECLKADFVRVSESVSALSVTNIYAAQVTLDDSLVAVIYEKAGFEGRHQYIYKSQ
jgi:hypothetical protein